jgi:hypothetical protein
MLSHPSCSALKIPRLLRLFYFLSGAFLPAVALAQEAASFHPGQHWPDKERKELVHARFTPTVGHLLKAVFDRCQPSFRQVLEQDIGLFVGFSFNFLFKVGKLTISGLTIMVIQTLLILLAVLLHFDVVNVIFVAVQVLGNARESLAGVTNGFTSGLVHVKIRRDAKNGMPSFNS